MVRRYQLQNVQHLIQSLNSLSGKTCYHQISWSLEAARLDVAMVVSLWNLTGTSAAVLPRYLPNFRAIGKVQTRISRLRDFTTSCGKTSYRLVNRGPGPNELIEHLWSHAMAINVRICDMKTSCAAWQDLGMVTRIKSDRKLKNRCIN